MVLPQAMAWVQYWFRVLSLKFCGKSKKNCGDISQVSPAFCMYDCKLLAKISWPVPRCRAWWPPLCTRTLMWRCTWGGGGTSWASARTTGEGLGNLLLAEDKKSDAHWLGMRWSRRWGRRRWTTGTFRSAGRPRCQVDSQIHVFQDESTCLFLFSPKLHSFKPDSLRCSNCPNSRISIGEPLSCCFSYWTQ